LRLLPIVMLASACAARGPNLQDLTAEQLFERGITALNARKWTRAAESFERFVLQFPTNPRAQEARFRWGQAFYGRKEYIQAATEFDRLAGDFPAGPWADDARFKVCESYVALSPKPPLDQQYTEAAFAHCTSFEQLYPNSELVPRAKQLAQEMMNRLAEKLFYTGNFYYKRKAFDSSITYFEMTVREYPGSNWAPQSLLRLFQAYTSIGYKEEAEAARARLIKEYPESEAARQLKANTVAKTS
jgi:outer membrane protein assembly factor BamD